MSQAVPTLHWGTETGCIYSWKLSDREEKVVVKHFSGSTTEDMKSHIQSLLRRDPDRVIIYNNNNIYIIITFFILG